MVNQYSGLFFLLGLFSGTTTFVIKLGSTEANVFTLILAGLIALRLIVSPSIKYVKHKKEKYLIGFYLFGIIANIISFFFEESVWKNANLNATIMTVFGVLGLLVLFSESELYKYGNYFIRGYKINCIIQIIWGILQYIVCEFFHIALNAQLGLSHSGVIVSPKYQVVGLGYERAQYCVLLIIGLVVFSSGYLKLLSAICIILTQSRTGVVMLVIVLICMYSFSEWKKIIALNSSRKIFSAALIIVFFVIMREWIINNFIMVQDKFNSLGKDASGAKHLSYYERFFDTMKSIGPLKTFFGFGTASSGYPYTLLYKTNDRGIAWNIESTWLANFWGYGVLGFYCWLNWMIRNCIRFFKQNRKIFAVFISVLIGGLGYQLMPNFVVITMLLVSIVYGLDKYN